jgi:hypothetical protein
MKRLTTMRARGRAAQPNARRANADQSERFAVAIDLNLSGKVLSAPFCEAVGRSITATGAI